MIFTASASAARWQFEAQQFLLMNTVFHSMPTSGTLARSLDKVTTALRSHNLFELQQQLLSFLQPMLVHLPQLKPIVHAA
jgi:hypothetical protein